MSHRPKQKPFVVVNESGFPVPPNDNASIELLDIDSGILPNRLTTEQRDAIPTPIESLLIYNTDSHAYQYYDSVDWASLTTGIGSAASSIVVGGATGGSQGFGSVNAVSYFINGSPLTALTGFTTNPTTVLGIGAGKNDAGQYHNTWIGWQSGYNNPGNTNSYAGEGNTGVGASVLYSNSTGNYNTAVGDIAMYNNISGNNNTTVGAWALYDLDSGSGNVAIGESAAFSINGNSNTCVGYYAGENLGGTVNYNICIGASSAVPISDGNYQLAIGGYDYGIKGILYGAEPNYVEFLNMNLVIDYTTDFRFNGEGDSNWRIGLGTDGFTTSPLLINNTKVVSITTGEGLDGGGNDGFAVGSTTGSSSLEIRGSDHTAYFSGNVGIQNYSPAYPLDVAGDINISGSFLINGTPLNGLDSWSPGSQSAPGWPLSNNSGSGLASLTESGDDVTIIANQNIVSQFISNDDISLDSNCQYIIFENVSGDNNQVGVSVGGNGSGTGMSFSIQPNGEITYSDESTWLFDISSNGIAFSYDGEYISGGNGYGTSEYNIGTSGPGTINANAFFANGGMLTGYPSFFATNRQIFETNNGYLGSALNPLPNYVANSVVIGGVLSENNLGQSAASTITFDIWFGDDAIINNNSLFIGFLSLLSVTIFSITVTNTTISFAFYDDSNENSYTLVWTTTVIPPVGTGFHHLSGALDVSGGSSIYSVLLDGANISTEFSGTTYPGSMTLNFAGSYIWLIVSNSPTCTISDVWVCPGQYVDPNETPFSDANGRPIYQGSDGLRLWNPQNITIQAGRTVGSGNILYFRENIPSGLTGSFVLDNTNEGAINDGTSVISISVSGADGSIWEVTLSQDINSTVDINDNIQFTIPPVLVGAPYASIYLSGTGTNWLNNLTGTGTFVPAGVTPFFAFVNPGDTPLSPSYGGPLGSLVVNPSSVVNGNPIFGSAAQKYAAENTFPIVVSFTSDSWEGYPGTPNTDVSAGQGSIIFDGDYLWMCTSTNPPFSWNYITLDGKYPSGSSASPSITFFEDTTSGVYQPESFQVGAVTRENITVLFDGTNNTTQADENNVYLSFQNTSNNSPNIVVGGASVGAGINVTMQTNGTLHITDTGDTFDYYMNYGGMSYGNDTLGLQGLGTINVSNGYYINNENILINGTPTTGTSASVTYTNGEGQTFTISFTANGSSNNGATFNVNSPSGSPGDAEIVSWFENAFTITPAGSDYISFENTFQSVAGQISANYGSTFTVSYSSPANDSQTFDVTDSTTFGGGADATIGATGQIYYDTSFLYINIDGSWYKSTLTTL